MQEGLNEQFAVKLVALNNHDVVGVVDFEHGFAVSSEPVGVFFEGNWLLVGFEGVGWVLEVAEGGLGDVLEEVLLGEFSGGDVHDADKPEPLVQLLLLLDVGLPEHLVRKEQTFPLVALLEVPQQLLERRVAQRQLEEVVRVVRRHHVVLTALRRLLYLSEVLLQLQQ